MSNKGPLTTSPFSRFFLLGHDVTCPVFNQSCSSLLKMLTSPSTPLPAFLNLMMTTPARQEMFMVSQKAGVEPSLLENLDSRGFWMHFVFECVLLTGETCKSQITISPCQGWGTTYSCAPNPAPILQEVEIPIVSDTVCEAASSNSPFNAPTIGGGCATFLNVNYTNLISPDMVCAGSAGKIVHTYFMVIFEQ